MTFSVPLPAYLQKRTWTPILLQGTGCSSAGFTQGQGCNDQKGISDVQVFDEDEIKQEYGLTPSQIIDLKALMGDSSIISPAFRGGQKQPQASS